MSYLYIKSLHIIFVVTWFSGMFYLCRLYIYQRESFDKVASEQKVLLEQFGIMTRRLLYGITLPSAILTWIFGLWLSSFYNPVPQWLWIKLGMVVLLTLYHYSLHRLYHRHRENIYEYSSFQLRLWNEVPTIFLIGVVLLVVVKDSISLFYGGVGLIGFTALLYFGATLYKKWRKE